MDVLAKIKQAQDKLILHGFNPTANFSEETSENSQTGTPFVNCYPVVIAFYIFCSFGVFGNCVTVLIVCRHGLNTTTNILLCSLSVSDLAFSICNIVKYYNMKYSQSLNMETILKSKSSSYILHLIYDLTLSFSYHIVALISIERLLAVSLPFSVAKLSTPHRIKCVIIWLFLYVVVVSSLENNITYYYLNKIFTINDMTMLGLIGTVRTRIVFIVYRLTFVSIVPLTTVFLCTTLTIIKLSMTSRKMKNLNNNNRTSKTIKNLRVIKMLVMVCVVFVVLVSPVTVLHTVFNITLEPGEDDMFVCYVLHQLVASVNFIIYVKMSSKFSKAFNILLCCKCKPLKN